MHHILIPFAAALVAAGPIAARATDAAAPVAGTPAASPATGLRDPTDGWLDLSGFLDTTFGFVPVVAPITEPAVGYGAAGALLFIDRAPAAAGHGPPRPNIAAAGVLATDNGSRGWFAGHVGNWQDGRLRTLVGLADADLNLQFFGLGDDPAARDGLDYAVAATGGVAGGSYRVGQSPLWIGVRYARASTQVRLRAPGFELPETSTEDLELDLAALTPSLTLDTRDNFFTPTRGWYADLSVPVFRAGLGGDRDFETLTLQAMYYRPLGPPLYFGVRGAARASSDGTPFYLRPYVALRGVQALRYQGEQVAEAEAELRWQFHPRFGLVGFGGGGITRSDVRGRERTDGVGAGGLGFRYLLARTYGLHMGLDVAFGPDDPVLYVVFGSHWLRP